MKNWMTRLMALAAVAALLCAGGAVQASSILGTGSGALLGNDLTDQDDVHNEGAGTGFDAVFAADQEQYFNGAEGAFNVFDNAVGGGGAKWCCGNSPGGFPHWVQATFPGGYKLTHFTVTSSNDSPQRDPRVWTVEGSVDGTNFDPIFAETNPGGTLWTARNQVRLFEDGTGMGDFPTQTDGYSTFRLTTASTGAVGGADFAINEIELFGVPWPRTLEIGGIDATGTMTLTGTQSNEVYSAGVTGRFVQVKNNGTANRSLHIGELEVFATGATPTGGGLNGSIDLALSSKGASVYATVGGGGHGNPLATIDGAEQTGGATWTKTAVGTLITIDLGGTFDVGTARVHQRNDSCCQDRLRDFSVNVFADDGTGNPGASIIGSANYPGQPPTNSFGEVSLSTLASADVTATLVDMDIYVFDIGSNDQLIVDDNGQPGVFKTILNVNNATLEIQLLPGGGPYMIGNTYRLLVADQILGTFDDIILPAGMSFDTSNLYVTGEVTIIPEPMTMLAVGMGIASIGGYIRKRRRA